MRREEHDSYGLAPLRKSEDQSSFLRMLTPDFLARHDDFMQAIAFSREDFPGLQLASAAAEWSSPDFSLRPQTLPQSPSAADIAEPKKLAASAPRHLGGEFVLLRVFSAAPRLRGENFGCGYAALSLCASAVEMALLCSSMTSRAC
jgi:hypothetical protein